MIFIGQQCKDKENYVRNVAKWLGKDNIIYDEFTFEEGERPLDEILKGLDKSELFVLFLSNNALESEWVKTEVTGAKTRLDDAIICKVFPIIIEEGLKYNDPRIPSWLRDNYNLKPIQRAQVAAKRIHSKLRELSWKKHPQLKVRQNLFVGRNDKQEEFEERIHDFDKDKPTVIVASGMPGFGRRTFLHKALCKTSIVEDSYRSSTIFLDRNASIEDFILKLNDLGFVDFGDDLLSLLSKSVAEKILLIHRVMEEVYINNEIITIIDDACILSFERTVTAWFAEAIEQYSKSNFPIFCLASRFKVPFHNRPNNNKYYFVELTELNPKERKRLFAQLLEIEKVVISKEDFADVLNLLFGLPEQIMFAVDLLKDDNLTKLSDKLPVLTDYNSDKASILLTKYEGNNQALEFIRLLAQFEIISSDFIFSIVPEEEYYPILESLVAEHVCELIGIDGEIIRLSDVIRDYIKRNKLYVTDEFNKSIETQVCKLVKDDDIFQKDSSEFIFAIKESLLIGVHIDESLMIPSHYLRCMKDLYYNKENNKRIIELADIILEKKDNIDIGIIKMVPIGWTVY